MLNLAGGNVVHTGISTRLIIPAHACIRIPMDIDSAHVYFNNGWSDMSSYLSRL
jgi:hypothetical protein